MFRRLMSSKSFFERPQEAQSKNYILLVVPVATFCLGSWQLYRLRWKLNLIDERTTRTRMQPLEMKDLPDSLDDIRGLEYRRVKLTGTFDHDKEVYISPRSPINSVPGGLISNTSSHGGHVITPFRVSDTKTTVLIDRGWVPKNLLDPERRAGSQIKGETTVVAVLRNSEKGNRFTPDAQHERRNYHIRNIEEMAEQLGTAPVFLEATSESNVPGGPVGGQTVVQMRNEHLNYALTWYALSLVSAFLWYNKFVKKRSFR